MYFSISLMNVGLTDGVGNGDFEHCVDWRA